MYFIVYKTTCLINNKYYIGCHKTSALEDGYFGSGRALLSAVEKHGIQNFTREILCLCSSQEEMFVKEKELVTEEIVRDRKSYNLKIGGTANFYYININKLNHKSNQHLKHAENLKNNKDLAKSFADKISLVSGFRKLNNSRTPEERSAAAKKAAKARWESASERQRHGLQNL